MADTGSGDDDSSSSSSPYDKPKPEVLAVPALQDVPENAVLVVDSDAEDSLRELSSSLNKHGGYNGHGHGRSPSNDGTDGTSNPPLPCSPQVTFAMDVPAGTSALSATPPPASPLDEEATNKLTELLLSRHNSESQNKQEEGSEIDNRSIYSLPSIYSTTDDEGDVFDPYQTGYGGPGGQTDYVNGFMYPGRSMSVDGAHFEAARAEEDAEYERTKARVVKFRQVIMQSRKQLRLKVNPRTRTRADTARSMSVQQKLQQQTKQKKHDQAVAEGLEESSESDEEPFSLWNVSKQDKLMLMAMFLVDLSVYMSLSVMAPFFPQEAASKGLSSTISGWVFGVFALVQCVMSPIFGLIIPHVGPRFLFLAGQFFAGGCSILFGLLTFIPITESNTTYVVLCFTLRMSLAVGCTACSTASFAVTASQFSDGATQVFGILEMGAGLGLMAGPALGGVLYEFGGFAAPFASLGIFLLLTVPLNYVLLPKDVGSQETEKGPAVSMLQMLSIPAVAVVCMATFIGSVAWSIMDPTLAPHFEVFGLSPSMLGLVFLLMSAFYAISSPFWGWICDKVEDSSPLLFIGFAVCTVGFLLLGPSPILGFHEGYNSLWLNLVALSILGLSISLAVIPTYDKLLDAAEKAGIEEGIEMYSMIAGLWSSVYALGDFAGPTVGGLLLDKVGFPWTMTYAALATSIMAVIVLLLWLFEWRYGPSQRCSCCQRSTKVISIEEGGGDRPAVAGVSETTPLLSESV